MKLALDIIAGNNINNSMSVRICIFTLRIKIITNAGGVNPEVCKNKLLELATTLNVDIKVTIIKVDDILDSLEDLILKGVNFENMDDSSDFELIKDKVYSANAYIDSFSIAEALDTGAEIVLAGRVIDPGLVVGPAIYEFGWKKDDYDKLATATLAGHVIECGAQCTGGNYSDWDKVNDLINIGYPIVTLKDECSFLVSKPENSGGVITDFDGNDIFYGKNEFKNPSIILKSKANL